ALAEGIGVDPARFLEAVEGGPLDLTYLRLKAGAMIERKFEPSFRLTLAAKDARLVLEAAERHDLELPLLEVIAERLAEGASEHRPLARRLAARYGYTSEPLEDLVQVASTALVLAADRFDPGRGVSFASFAIPTIMGELKRHIRDHGWAARVPRSLQENVLKVTATADELGGRLGRSPSPRELATETGMDVESVLEAMLAASAFESTSLDGHADDGDGRVEPRVAVLGVDEHGYEQVERAVTLWPVVAALPDDERAVIALR